MSFFRSRHIAILLPLLAVLALSCKWTDKEMKALDNSSRPRSVNKRYTKQAAMNIYAYQPVKALQILDSAVMVGNMSEFRAEMYRARIYNSCMMSDQVDSLLGGPKGIGTTRRGPSANACSAMIPSRPICSISSMCSRC